MLKYGFRKCIIQDVSGRKPMDYKKYIRDVPDFPVEGILFRDLTTLWKDPEAFRNSIDELYEMVKDLNIQKVVGAESRGFILGSVLAYKLGCGFVPVRKQNKLPYKTLKYEYSLEYGFSTLEIHEDSINEGERVLVVDDLLATGGTAKAMIELVRQLKGNPIGALFWVELSALKGRDNIDIPVYSLVVY